MNQQETNCVPVDTRHLSKPSPVIYEPKRGSCTDRIPWIRMESPSSQANPPTQLHRLPTVRKPNQYLRLETLQTPSTNSQSIPVSLRWHPPNFSPLSTFGQKVGPTFRKLNDDVVMQVCSRISSPPLSSKYKSPAPRSRSSSQFEPLSKHRNHFTGTRSSGKLQFIFLSLF